MYPRLGTSGLDRDTLKKHILVPQCLFYLFDLRNFQSNCGQGLGSVAQSSVDFIVQTQAQGKVKVLGPGSAAEAARLEKYSLPAY